MNIDIKHIAKTITRKKQGLQDPQLIYPERDWAIGVVGTLVVILAALGFSVWQYQSYTDMSHDEAVESTMVPYRAAQVEQALTEYRAKAATHAVIIAVPGSNNSNVGEDGNEEDEDNEEKNISGATTENPNPGTSTESEVTTTPTESPATDTAVDTEASVDTPSLSI